MENLGTTHHVPGAFPDIRIAPPQKRKRTTDLPQIFVPPLLSLKTIECACQILCAGPRPFSAPESGAIWRIQR